MIRRREFIAGLGGVAAWPLAARAQPAKVPVIGVLYAGSAYQSPPMLHEGLRQAGYIEGRNVAIENQWADGQYDRLPALAAELVRRKVSVIYAWGVPSSVAAKMATTAIPIVFRIGADPVELGLVASLNHPGSNVTGVTSLAGESNVKRLELITETVPAAKVVAAFVNPSEQNSSNLARNLHKAASGLGIELHVLPISTEADFDSAFKIMRERGVGALVISPDSVLDAGLAETAARLLRDHVPAISWNRQFVLAGGLISYAPDELEMARVVGDYIGRILKGDKPGDLPVHQAAKFILTINLKTAKSLGLDVPTAILLRANEVIE